MNSAAKFQEVLVKETRRMQRTAAIQELARVATEQLNRLGLVVENVSRRGDRVCGDVKITWKVEESKYEEIFNFVTLAPQADRAYLVERPEEYGSRLAAVIRAFKDAGYHAQVSSFSGTEGDSYKHLEIVIAQAQGAQLAAILSKHLSD